MRFGNKWRWIGCMICVILISGVGLLILQKGTFSNKVSSNTEDKHVSDTSSDHTDEAELIGENPISDRNISQVHLQDLGQQNILSDGEYLYTIHRKNENEDLVQIFRVEESKISQVWSTSVGADARMNVDGGEFTIIYPENGTEECKKVWDVSDPGQPKEVSSERKAAKAASGATPQGIEPSTEDREAMVAEYPFGEDLTFRLEIAMSQKKQGDIRLVMTRTSTGESLHDRLLRIRYSDWVSRMADNIIVDHQHSYIGIGCRSKQGHSLYQLYYYNEAEGFRKLAEYDWGEGYDDAESCGWIRGNQVYIFSPDGSRVVVYDVVSEEFHCR